MIRTGTSAMTREASANTVERNRPKEELIKAHNSTESKLHKKTPALLFRLQGKYAITKNKNGANNYTGKTAKDRPMKYAEVEYVLLSLSRMKTGLSKLKRLTEEKTKAKTVFITMKNSTPALFCII